MDSIHNKKNIIILTILIIILSSTVWFGSDGYRELNSKMKDIKSISIYDSELRMKIISTFTGDGSKFLSPKELSEKTLINTITNHDQIKEFTNNLNPKVFSFELLGCNCSGQFKIVFEYLNGKKFDFAIAHGRTIKMRNYRDWPLKTHLHNLNVLRPAQIDKPKQ